jgi:hypothetical protein
VKDMSNIDFQNGFITGLTVKNGISKKNKTTSSNVQADGYIAQVILPIILDPMVIEIDNKIIQADSSVNLEE